MTNAWLLSILVVSPPGELTSLRQSRKGVSYPGAWLKLPQKIVTTAIQGLWLRTCTSHNYFTDHWKFVTRESIRLYHCSTTSLLLGISLSLSLSLSLPHTTTMGFINKFKLAWYITNHLCAVHNASDGVCKWQEGSTARTVVCPTLKRILTFHTNTQYYRYREYSPYFK